MACELVICRLLMCDYCFANIFPFSCLVNIQTTIKLIHFFLIHWAMMGVEWNVRRHLNKNNKNLRIRNVLLLLHAMIWDIHIHILVVYSIVIWNKHGMCWCHGKFSFTSTAYPLITMNKIFYHELHIRKEKNKKKVLFYFFSWMSFEMELEKGEMKDWVGVGV